MLSELSSLLMEICEIYLIMLGRNWYQIKTKKKRYKASITDVKISYQPWISSLRSALMYKYSTFQM